MKYLKFIFLLSIVFTVNSFSDNKDNLKKKVTSPDGRIQINILLESGKPFYEVSCDNKSIINKSGFSFDLKDQPPLNKSFVLESVDTLSFNETWKPLYGNSESIRNNYNEATIKFKEYDKLKRCFWIVARAYNDGVAFRYVFPKEPVRDSIFITAENTSFNFPADDTAWWIPSNEFAYESLYRNSPLTEISSANTPLTIQTRGEYFISIHEAALLDYSEMTLKRKQHESLSFVSSLWPESDGVCARVRLPFKTPWRCIMIARRAGGLIESHLIQNLNDPCAIKDVSWIKPMKFVGVWWGMHIGKYTWYEGPNHGATTERTKTYIDFAASHNIGGVLAEGWNIGWETWASDKKNVQNFCKAYPDFDIESVVKYAKEKNVEFISHHETGGNIPEYEKQLDSAFALCQRLGIRAVKTGYAGTIFPEGYHHHGQYMVKHFQKVVETAAKYNISLDVHESIKPTGIDRTWPNLLTQEGARGNEWNATYKATPPYHTTILPFTRFLGGPYDFTPGIFRIVHSSEKNKRLYCTLANQLALFVVFYSPMMMVSDMIENYNNPAFKFIEDVPCTWDETLVVGAKLGDYVSIARRKKNEWFIGTLADENCYLIKIPVSFLDKGKKYVATIYSDSITTDWEKSPELIEIGEYIVTAKDTIYTALSKAGGQAVRIRPAITNEERNILLISEYNKNAILKMKVFRNLKTYGDCFVTHLAVKKPVSIINPYSDRYPASGKNALTDGIRGMLNYSAGSWQGYEGVDMDVTIALQKEMKIQKITAGFLEDPNDWIFAPKKIEFFISDDGKNFKFLKEEVYPAEKPADMSLINIRNFSAGFSPLSIRYVRIKASGIIICPEWHQGRGKKAWLFCDEIIVE